MDNTEEFLRSSLGALTRELTRRRSTSVCSAIVSDALREAGINRMRPIRKSAARAAVQCSAPRHMIYADHDVRADGAGSMKTEFAHAD